MQPARSTPASVALLIDTENFTICARMPSSMQQLVDQAGHCGRLVLARAYGDWSQPGLIPCLPAIQQAGITPIQVPGQQANQFGVRKNSTDLYLAVEAMELCLLYPQLGTFIIVSGDRDFLHLVHALRRQGRTVIVGGMAATLSRQLAQAADGVLTYAAGRFVAQARAHPAPQGKPDGHDNALVTTTVAPAPTAATIGHWIGRTVARRRSISLADLGTALRAEFGADCRTLLGLSLKELAAQLHRQGVVRHTTERGVDYLAVPDPAPISAPPPLTTLPIIPDQRNPTVLDKLGPQWLPIVLRVIASAEAAAQGAAHHASLALQLRQVLSRDGGPTLGSSETGRLIKRELVAAGYLIAEERLVADRITGAPRPLTVYRLDRDNPAVRQSLLTGPVMLDPAITIYPAPAALPASAPVGQEVAGP